MVLHVKCELIILMILLSLQYSAYGNGLEIQTNTHVKAGGYLYSHTSTPVTEEAINGNGDQIYSRKVTSNKNSDEERINFASTYSLTTALNNECPCKTNPYEDLKQEPGSSKGVLNLSWRLGSGSKCNEYYTKFEDQNVKVTHSIDVQSYGDTSIKNEMSSDGNIGTTNFHVESKGNLSERIMDTEKAVPQYQADTELRGDFTFDSKMRKEIDQLDWRGLLYKLDGVNINAENAVNGQALHAKSGRSLAPEDQATAYYNNARNQLNTLTNLLNNKTPDNDSITKVSGNMLEDLSSALNLKPDFYDALCAKGYVLFELKRYQDAAQAYDDAINLQKDGIAALSGKARALFDGHDWLGASFAYKDALDVEPNDVTVLIHYGQSLYNLGRYDQAITVFGNALKLYPNSGELHYSNGFALLAAKHYDDAASEFKIAANSTSNDITQSEKDNAKNLTLSQQTKSRGV